MQKDEEETKVIVEEALPNALFRVTDEKTNEKFLAYLSGKMRLHRIKVLIGDKVLIKKEPYGGRARIIKRL